MLALGRAGLLHAAAHITGGGFFENVPRALPPGLGVRIERGSWVEQPVFGFVQRASGASDDEMFSTFNMGIGMALVAAPADLDDLMREAPQAVPIGSVVEGAGVAIV